ncbi:methylated-DNA--[protein]-cysteine S-methyltransferase [Actinocorallia sp. A-T 12471]|uniref:methylated-DNA--[protein]-cysteine S-methyltransferase n=1 Tax=Actinocorallia sp. A-T 12471 TaxID=3089813 RepID=UPI0029CE2D85|nr:methylated-DNA--[protein]-cysteine S-methyltransferase [Actinocorallia sp. A-T 12471]MDX6744932.1 methylated-DNA--[protein]-cysteine S-methyltransferase [Actinocorallia sp. A-T 12471]
MQSFGWSLLQTPIGPLLFAETETGLVAVRFHAHEPESEAAALGDRLGRTPVRGGAREACAQLSAYFAGDLNAFTLPLDWRLVTGFSRHVLRELYTSVGYGQVITYGALAARAGSPDAARAVGVAMAANPLPVVVPCHRVVGGDGLGGFGGGRTTKEELLSLEGSLPATLFLEPKPPAPRPRHVRAGLGVRGLWGWGGRGWGGRGRWRR